MQISDEKIMSLVSAVETLQRRPLTAEEMRMLAELQSIHKLDDDDPLIVVLALMARSQLIVGSLPDLLQQKAIETIELHRTVLREQSILISKELIAAVAENIQNAKLAAKVQNSKVEWFRYAACFVAGIAFTVITTPSVRHLLSGGN